MSHVLNNFEIILYETGGLVTQINEIWWSGLV